MNLLIIGINHTSAPVELREKVAFTPEQLEDALNDISKQAGLQEVAILSTCNRTEVIASGDNIASLKITNWLADYHQIDPAELEHSIYILNDNKAAHHAMRVACGLDSMVVGEPQILGQFKECFDQARQFGKLGGGVRSSVTDQLSSSQKGAHGNGYRRELCFRCCYVCNSGPTAILRSFRLQHSSHWRRGNL